MSDAPNLSDTTTSETRCIVNDQMTPFIVLYSLVFIISLPGVLLSVWAFIRSHRAEQRSTTVYLINLLAADLLLLLALPFKILKDLRVAPWSLAVFHCQASAVAVYISLYAAIAFLAFTIIDRYLQDHHTVNSLKLQGAGFARLLSLVVWTLLLLIMVPNMALPTKEVKEQPFLSCSSLKSDIGMHWHALSVVLNTALFLNASAAVLVSGGLALKRLLRSRHDAARWGGARRVARNVLVLSLAYVLAFVPYHVVRAPYTLAQANVITDCSTRRRLFLGKEATLLLSALHLAFDPLLCFYLHAPFRHALTHMLRPSGHNQEVNEREEEEEEENMKTTENTNQTQI